MNAPAGAAAAANMVNEMIPQDRLEKAIRKQVLQEVEEPPAPDGRKRSEFIGGSEAAAVIGLSPWATPLDVYFSKTGTRPPSGAWRDPVRERNFKRGRRAEPHAIDMAVEELGIKVTKRSTPENKNYYIDPEHPFLACEIDFEWEPTADVVERYDLPEDLIGTTQNGEVKSVHPFASGKFGEEGTEEVPVEYAAQAMHGLMITNRRLTMFLVLTGWDDLSVYWIWRDEESITHLRSVEVKFWNAHVLPRVPPAPQNLPDVYRLFKRVGEHKVECTELIAGMIEELVKSRAEKKKAEDTVEDVQFRLGCAILGQEVLEKPDNPGKTVVLRGDTPVLVIDFQQNYDLNEAKLKAMYPAAAEDCAKLQQFFVIRVPKKKAEGAAPKKSRKST